MHSILDGGPGLSHPPAAASSNCSAVSAVFWLAEVYIPMWKCSCRGCRHAAGGGVSKAGNPAEHARGRAWPGVGAKLAQQPVQPAGGAKQARHGGRRS